MHSPIILKFKSFLLIILTCLGLLHLDQISWAIIQVRIIISLFSIITISCRSHRVIKVLKIQTLSINGSVLINKFSESIQMYNSDLFKPFLAKCLLIWTMIHKYAFTHYFQEKNHRIVKRFLSYFINKLINVLYIYIYNWKLISCKICTTRG